MGRIRTSMLIGMLELAFLVVVAHGIRVARRPTVSRISVGSGLLACGVLIAACQPSPALADWRYCLALSEDSPRVLVSDPFESAAPIDGVERQFALLLSDAGLPPGTVQCPRAGTEAAVREMRAYSREYNIAVGRDPIDLGWSPGARWVGRTR